ncbi:exo-alpha-sialidase [Kitasatospora viridis]|uniref:Glycosyl hydrolase n=2 Tax=Kitasatospora viridis TaxID=281105 RepID=A0A561UGQ3_9ACTN|nr:hypothetical protein FHX73_112356 [Kitasatospora viridis]
MSARLTTGRWLTICAITATMTLTVGSPAGAAPLPHAGGTGSTVRPLDKGDGGDDESDSIQEGADQRAEARTAPGVVAPGAFTAAWDAMKALPASGGDWRHTTGLVYNSDDPRYRDTSSNSSAGMGDVTGRMSAVAADDQGHVYAGSAGGGVWRSSTGGGHWQPISDQLPSQATGALALDAQGRLWLGTGEASTNSDAYLGSGVYVLDHPASGKFSTRSRVGGSELDSTTIHELRFGGNKVWAATSHGVWSHSTTDLSGPWTLEFAPNPDYLPGGKLANDPSAPYKNLANDIAIDANDPSKVVLAIGWRSGDPTNGFYSKAADGSWQRASSLGDLPTDAANVGEVTFARSADGSRYYAIDQSPALQTSNPASALDGIFVSKSGSPLGPWTRIADATKLGNSGSALNTASQLPGQQSWYDQSLQVDPTDPNHVWAGLEEVFETKDGGTSWSTPGPYWNFNFPCWSIDPTKQSGSCPQTTHPDQHALAVGSLNGKPYVVAGNDGGLYSRPVNGQVDPLGHATDWKSLNDGTIDTLEYYSVGVGKDLTYGGVSVTGGMQDNGQSMLRGGHDKVMGSNFGGDGGGTLTDPANGCNIAQEYVYLAVNVTQNCAVNDGSYLTDPSKATSFSVAPPDNAAGPDGARFIAPLAADQQNSNLWVAGGRHVWVQTQGYAIRSSTAWQSAFDLGDGHLATAVAASGGKVYAAWCGPCDVKGFTRGLAVGNADGTGWQQLTLPVDGTVPNRYLAGLAVDPKNSSHVYLAVNGFSRAWTGGPGAGVGHVFESTDAGAHWSDISANLPDVPADSLAITPSGGLALATDLGVVYRPAGQTGWERVGHLPAVAVDELQIGADGRLYAATHGRGIWSVDLCALDGNDQGDQNQQ